VSLQTVLDNIWVSWCIIQCNQSETLHFNYVNYVCKRDGFPFSKRHKIRFFSSQEIGRMYQRNLEIKLGIAQCSPHDNVKK